MRYLFNLEIEWNKIYFKSVFEKMLATRAYINTATPTTQWHTHKKMHTGTFAESVALLNMHISVVPEFMQEQ